MNNTTNSSVEITKYRPMDKGALKGFFSVYIPMLNLDIYDCSYFSSKGKAWFNFPQKEVSKDPTKKEYFPQMKFRAPYDTMLKDAILKALKEIENNGQAQENRTAATTKLQGDSSPLPF